jgi:hypothetical protein
MNYTYYIYWNDIVKKYLIQKFYSNFASQKIGKKKCFKGLWSMTLYQIIP